MLGLPSSLHCLLAVCCGWLLIVWGVVVWLLICDFCLGVYVYYLVCYWLPVVSCGNGCGLMLFIEMWCSHLV